MAKSIWDENLFEEEKNILQLAMDDIANPLYEGNALLPQYQSFTVQYQKLLRLTGKIFRISDMQGRALQRIQSDMQNLLDNANQGFLTFGADLKVDAQYSAECVQIFERKISGLFITDLLQEGSTLAQEKLHAIFSDLFLPEESLAHQEALQQFPALFRVCSKDIRIECKILPAGSTITEPVAMMILTDVTESLSAEEKIRFLSYHDKLTYLYNRAHIEEILPEMEKQEALPVSIIVVDMNGLKLANDVFGHHQGDKLLMAMAAVLRQSCRLEDVIARWGGDEFLVLLPRTDEEECAAICQKIRDACKDVVDCAVPVSAAIGSATKDTELGHIVELFNIAENRMYNDKMRKGKAVRKTMIASLETMLYERCFESKGHNARVQEMAVSFALFLHFSPQSDGIKQLKQLAALHDIGKVAIPAEILGKPGPLSKSEWDIVKVHSDVGYRMAQSIGEVAVAELILALHERWDGTGYPYGLKEEQIPLLDRIFSLVDIYDIMIHDRPYKSAVDHKEALRQIEAARGLAFDPLLTNEFLKFVQGKSNTLLI